jgi:hypothetical protein
VRFALFAIALPCLAQPPAPAVKITMSPQASPFPLAKGMTLYSAGTCGAIARSISTAQIRNAAEGAGITWLDPAFYASALATGTSNTHTARLLNISKWSALGVSVGAGVETVLKAQSSTVTSNTKTWAIVTTTTAAAGAGIGVLQPLLQSAANAQGATMTGGVQAALVAEGGIYTMLGACGGFTKSVMFFGSGGPAGVVSGVIP